MKTLIIPAFFVTGIILGFSSKVPESLISQDLSTLILSILLFLAGRGIGFTDEKGVYFKGSDINRKYSLKGIEELLSYKHQEKQMYNTKTKFKI